MDIRDMELKEYCCLNRPRFRVDPEADAQWFFGNKQVSQELSARIVSDFDIRGAPKCLLWGRFGCGKTHTLFHLKNMFQGRPDEYPAIGVVVSLAPYDEAIANLGGWRYLHNKMLDQIGEGFLKQIVQEFDRLPENRTAELSEEMCKVFKFGDENLKKSLSNVLTGYFKRDVRSTLPAWQWLKGSKVDKGSTADDLGVTKALENAEDMVNVVMNLGNLVQRTRGRCIVFLMDEAQALAEVKKGDTEIHHAFLQLASDYNQDVGFVIAYFAAGIQQIPPVLARPPDILSRLGVTMQNLDDACINLSHLINTAEDVRTFISDLLQNTKDIVAASSMVTEMGLADRVTAEHLPFTEDGIDRAVEVLFQSEETRNPRMIINELARVAATAYHEGKKANEYVVVDSRMIGSTMRV